jgi:hypothetical protein
LTEEHPIREKRRDNRKRRLRRSWANASSKQVYDEGHIAMLGQSVGAFTDAAVEIEPGGNDENAWKTTPFSGRDQVTLERLFAVLI